VLGKRWIYDGTQDPVLLTQLAELIQGRAEAQAQSQSNTPDRTVHAVPVDGAPSERLSVLFARRLVPADPAAAAKPGQVTGLWTAPDGALIRSVFATARPARAR
jgi:sarcosine oxidase gamma subunit